MERTERRKRQKRALAILGIVLLGCAVMAVTDGVIEPPYAVKSAVKLLFFAAIPGIYLFFTGDERFRRFLTPKKARLLPALLLGIGVFAVIVGGYFLLRGKIDFSGAIDSLAGGEGVTKENFPFVAVYISLVNSFCEELFFRGLAFGALSGVLSHRAAYLFSSLAFAVYHVAILSGWFSPLLIALFIAALAAAGMIFDRIDDGADSVYPSWIVHLFANLGINTVGMILFGIL